MACLNSSGHEFENLLDELKSAKSEEKKQAKSKLLEWVSKNAASLGTLAVELTKAFTGWPQGELSLNSRSLRAKLEEPAYIFAFVLFRDVKNCSILTVLLAQLLRRCC